MFRENRHRELSVSRHRNCCGGVIGTPPSQMMSAQCASARPKQASSAVLSSTQGSKTTPAATSPPPPGSTARRDERSPSPEICPPDSIAGWDGSLVPAGTRNDSASRFWAQDRIRRHRAMSREYRPPPLSHLTQFLVLGYIRPSAASTGHGAARRSARPTACTGTASTRSRRRP